MLVEAIVISLKTAITPTVAAHPTSKHLLKAGQLQEEEKALGPAPPSTDRKASAGKPFPSPAHPSLCLPWLQTSRISYTQTSRNKASKFPLLPGICSPALPTEGHGAEMGPRGGRHRRPPGPSLDTATPGPQKTAAHPPARTQMKTAPSWSQAITQAPKLGAEFISLLNVAMTTTSSFKR